jgi:hypothetical protein
VCGLLAWLPYLHTGDETEIISYSAPKESVRPSLSESASQAGPVRLWGAIIPLPDDVWFFKLTGPPDAVAAHESEIRRCLESVRFVDGEPTWTLPSEWTQKPGNEFRFATLVIPSTGKPLELTVSKLGRGGGSWDEQLLANINRWRGQVSLPPLSIGELPHNTERVEINGQIATVIDVIGKPK